MFLFSPALGLVQAEPAATNTVAVLDFCGRKYIREDWAVDWLTTWN